MSGLSAQEGGNTPSVPLQLDQYLVICAFLAFLFHSHLKLKGIRLRHYWLCCVYFCLSNTIKPMYIE
jgi:hypothetical protein